MTRAVLSKLYSDPYSSRYSSLLILHYTDWEGCTLCGDVLPLNKRVSPEEPALSLGKTVTGRLPYSCSTIFRPFSMVDKSLCDSISKASTRYSSRSSAASLSSRDA